MLTLCLMLHLHLFTSCVMAGAGVDRWWKHKGEISDNTCSTHTFPSDVSPSASPGMCAIMCSKGQPPCEGFSVEGDSCVLCGSTTSLDFDAAGSFYTRRSVREKGPFCKMDVGCPGKRQFVKVPGGVHVGQLIKIRCATHADFVGQSVPLYIDLTTTAQNVACTGCSQIFRLGVKLFSCSFMF